MTLQTTIRRTLARTPGPPTLLIVSDSHVGSTLAAEFESTASVTLVTDHHGVAGQAPDGVRVISGEVTDRETLGEAGDALAAVVALRADRRAVLATQLLRNALDIRDVVVLVNDPQRHEVFDNIGVATVCVSSHLSTELRQALETSLSTFEPAH